MAGQRHFSVVIAPMQKALKPPEKLKMTFKLVLFAVTAFTFIFTGISANAATDDGTLVMSAQHSFHAHAENSAHPVCTQADRIFLHPANLPYLMSDQSLHLSKLIFPGDTVDLHTVDWSHTNEGEFKDTLPLKHAKLLKFTARAPQSQKGISDIRKASLDVYNRKTTNDIYRVSFNDGSFRNYLFEPDDVRLGFERLFDDNASTAEPFIYENEVYFADKRGASVVILKYKTIAQDILPIQIACQYNMRPTKNP